jgi:hypothetical protein
MAHFQIKMTHLHHARNAGIIYSLNGFALEIILKLGNRIPAKFLQVTIKNLISGILNFQDQYFLFEQLFSFKSAHTNRLKLSDWLIGFME